MKSQTIKTNNAYAKPYKQLLIQAKNLQTNAKANVYNRVKLLVQVFDDADFRIDYGADDFVLAGILDQYIADIGWGFMELRSIIEHFPEEKDWRDGRLSRMHDDVIKDRRSKAAAAKMQDAPVRHKPRRVTNADLEAVKNENRQLRAKFKTAATRGIERNATTLSQSDNGKPHQNAESEVIMLRKQLTVARQRIIELEKENAELRRQLKATAVCA